jgi:subtilisin-like proprotein convertase family protein/subtilisin family serine protease
MPDLIPGNSSTTYSLVVGTSTSDAIDLVGDTDWWKVNLVVGFRYQVWIEGLGEGRGTLVDPYLGVYNGNGTFSHGNDNANASGLYSYAYVTPTASGYLFLSAEASGNKTFGTYTITVWQDELASTASAASIPVNSISGVGHIGWQGDVSDWYKVTLVAGVQYEFDLIGADGDGAAAGLTLADPYLVLRDSTGTSLSFNNDSGLTHNSRIFYTPTTTGTYFLDAQEFSNDAFGTYKVIVNSNPTAAALTLGTPQLGTIGFVGEVNLYSVSLTAGVTYAFAIDGTSLTDPYLELLDSSGTTAQSDDDSGEGLNSFLKFTPTTSGTYYLAARESGNNATGSYSATVWQLPSVSIANASVFEGNTGSDNLIFTLTLSVPSPIAVTVTAATSGTATATYSSDYTPAKNTVTFQPGQTTATFTVQVLGDYLFEPTEVFHVLLSNPTNALLGDADAYGSIFDNDNPYKLPIDPLLRLEWYLYPTTGIDVFPVWSEYTGAGVKVAVFDQGIDPAHPDLDRNLLTALGRNASNLSAGGLPVFSTDNHGTMVAGVIAAERNGDGVVGVAYGANLVSIYNGFTISEIPNAFEYAGNFDVLNDSWGFAPQGTSNYALKGNWAFVDNFLTEKFSVAGIALSNLAASGRHGLGTVVVQSAGNSFSVGDDTNLHNFQNSQYIITVAATDYSGNVTTYSSPGASVLIAAPGGGGGDKLSDIITTDRVGVAGNDPSNFTSTRGTSFSAPIASGIVALMLEANPNLGYRDVQEILAYSARKISATNNDWRYNGAVNWNGGGLHYDAIDHNLGYGLMDALAAVRLAETWSNIPHTASNKQQITTTRNPALVIPDNADYGVHDSILVSQPMAVERVEVTLNVTHPFIGDLSVLLTSPSGTTSFLLWRPQQNPLSAFGTNQDNIHFTFDTVLDWGESSLGSWSLGIYDHASGDVGTFDSWTLNLIGRTASVDDTYIYTDEFAKAALDQPSRNTLSDISGKDTLNAAACTSNLILNLVPGSMNTIAGSNLTISAGTVIENAYGGDGNDVITGNNADNVLYGMRGNDTLIGGSGMDTAAWTHDMSHYKLNMIDGVLRVTDKTGTDGMDTLTNIERLKFTDKSINLQIQAQAAAAPHADVARLVELYVAFFNRIPDADGLSYWISQKVAGQTINQIADTFYEAGVQYSSLTGFKASMSNTAFINVIYKNVLGRANGADAGGLDYWNSKLIDGSATRGSLVSTILDSAHTFKNDATYGYVANLLDNKIAVAQKFAIDWGLNYNTANESISQGMSIAAAITPTSTEASIALIGIDPTDIYLV